MIGRFILQESGKSFRYHVLHSNVETCFNGYQKELLFGRVVPHAIINPANHKAHTRINSHK